MQGMGLDGMVIWCSVGASFFLDGKPSFFTPLRHFWYIFSYTVETLLSLCIGLMKFWIHLWLAFTLLAVGSPQHRTLLQATNFILYSYPSMDRWLHVHLSWPRLPFQFPFLFIHQFFANVLAPWEAFIDASHRAKVFKKNRELERQTWPAIYRRMAFTLHRCRHGGHIFYSLIHFSHPHCRRNQLTWLCPICGQWINHS